MEMGNLKEIIMTYLLSPPMTGWLFNLRFAFIIISSIFLVGLVVFLFKNNWLKRLFIEDWIEFFTWQAYGINPAERIWKKVNKRLSSGQEPEYKLAVIEADKLLAGMLKKMEYGGKEVNEILNRLSVSVFPYLEEIKWAHNIHESIIHDPDFRLSLDDTKKAMDIYEKFFVDAEVL